MNLFVFGLGYSATSAVNNLADHCRRTGGFVSATTRTREKADIIAAKGLRAHVFSGDAPGDAALKADLQAATHILMSIAPGDSDPVLRHHGADIRAAPALEWIGYYSTVGVYGDHEGAWVSEAAALKPSSRRSKERVEAEDGWTALGKECGIPVSLIRLAGIYGPGRNTLVNLSDGSARRIIKPGQVFNRIHVADIARITEAAAIMKAHGVFNGADNEPAPPQDVVEYGARLMGLPVPPDIPFETANLSAMGRSFYGETKRVSNLRLKADLGIDLLYPTYREALDALWQSDTWREAPLLSPF